jgi:fluoroquinolone transport system permease protein
MRTKALLLGDIRFQFKYGFYFLYVIFAAVYISLLFALPDAWRVKTAVLMIFSDPAAMGLYFMGAIVLFEKSEQVLNSIAISPVHPSEYVLAKLVSIALISTLVGLIIGISSGIIGNIFEFTVGLFLCSCLFSSLGLSIAAKITTLNQFIIATIPAELVINIPAIAYLFGYKSNWLLLHPGVSMIELCLNGPNAFLAMVGLIVWSALFYFLACRVVQKMFQSVGGVKL